MYGNAVVDIEYFNWLIKQIDGSEYIDPRDYMLMLETIHNYEFRWTIANDINRSEDGKQLRLIFMDEERWSTEPKYLEGCSLLEMFIALAKRIEIDIMWDPDKGDRTSDWFWIMLDNMGLTDFSDDNFDSEKVQNICATFCARNFKSDGSGTGGAFPLRHPNGKNQRRVEIWYQMQAYLMENYDF